MTLTKQIIKKYPLSIIIALGIIILVVFAYFEYIITSGQWGAPLDDVYIHFQFSKNFVEGKGLSFNTGIPTSGSTAPAWTILISIFYALIRNHLFIAKALSAIFYLGIGVVTFYLGIEVFKSKKWAIITAVMTLLTGRLAWSALSGMEVTLFTFLFILSFLLYIKDRRFWVITLLMGLASTVRPEGYVLYGFFGIVETIKRITLIKSQGFFSFLKPLILSVIIYLAVISPYLIFSYVTTGEVLPNTFRAQSQEAQDLVFKLKLGGLYLFRYVYLMITDNPIATLAVPFGLASIYKQVKQKTINIRWIIFIVIVLGFPLVASIIAPNLRHHGRYTMPFIPLYTVVGIFGFKYLLRNHKHKRIRICLCVLILLYLVLLTLQWASTFAWNVKNINDLHVHLGNWIKDNTEEDDVLAINDIGAITYISQRQIIDTVGLVSPEVLNVTEGLTGTEKEEALWKYLEEQQPDYIIIFPVWYPEISQEDELEEIYRVKLDRYTIIDGEMVVYEFTK